MSYRMSHRVLAPIAALVLSLFAAADVSAEKLRPFELTGHAGSGPATVQPNGPVPRLINVALAVVDDSWTGLLSGTLVVVGANSYTIGTDAFATVQDGVDALSPGGTVLVLPGTYSETAAGRVLYDLSGPYQFGIFVGVASPGITIQGVDGAGNPITSAGAVAATINTNATNGFGPSGFFIEGDGVTIAGVVIGINSAGLNKTIEVIGDDFTLEDCDVVDLQGSVYINDFRYDSGLNISHIQSYLIKDCIFGSGVSIDLASGAGYSGPVAGRVISGNSFTNGPGEFWPMISFNGSGSGVPWFLYSVGGAVITGNTFTNTDATGQMIRARASYDNTQFDWATYWSGNTFNKAVVVGSAPPAVVRPYSYVSGPYTFNTVRRIGAIIQPEVDHGLAGDTVLIGAGAYEEQVIVNGLDLTLQGAGMGLTTVQSPAALAVNFGTDRRSVIACMNSGNIRVEDLTVDGLGRGNANNRMFGVGFWEAGGAVLDCRVTAIRETPLNGNQHGVGIAAFNTSGGPFALEVGDCDVDDYQKNGMALSGVGLAVDVHGCSTTGAGDLGFQAQNGIQVSFGASGSVSSCRVSDMRYTPATFVASGILVYQPGGPVSVSGLTGPNAIDEVQAPVSWYDGSGSLNGIETTGSLTAGIDFGPIFIGNFTAPLASAGVSSRPGSRPVFEGSGVGEHPEAQAPTYTAFNVSVSNSCLTGADVAGTAGVYGYSAGGSLSLTVSNSVVSDWDTGIYVDGGGVTVTANQNAISSNLTAGYDNTLGAPAQNAEFNWWGAGTGPGGVGPGTGDAVLGTGVDFTSWLSNNNDSDPGCGFAPAGDNTIAPVPPAVTCLNTCVTVPVNITRTDAIPMRGYSVKVTLSPELMLCTGLGSITEGSYLSSAGSTNFQVLSNGGGVYTVDCAILGASSCVTAASGTLFNLSVKRTVATGAGTVTVTPLKARDCVNGPINVSPGAPATVTVDTTAPVAVTNLSAAQVKVGNDTDGTTKVTLTFTAPGDAATIEVYRAGFGDYPEYDDGTGAVPATPTYPPGAPWALTAVTASGQADEVGARDFWYFVVFTKDICGNVSPVSNKTTGTLNYHLGDTHNGGADCFGNNKVLTEDMSFLGAHYGITIPYNGLYNCLDVGPTTDFSVDARPTTDSVIDFEDLIMFAINFNTVAKPGVPDRGRAGEGSEIHLEVLAAADLFDVSVRFSGGGDVQGLSLDLAYDPLVVEPLEPRAGELLERQGRGSTILSGRPGVVDLALLGVGTGISGNGELARMAFRRVGAGNPGIALRDVTARDLSNRPVQVTRGGDSGLTSPLPVRNYLAANYPNPFQHSTIIPFGVRVSGPVSLSIFDVQGRRVRDLIQGTLPAGDRTESWDGRDADGSPVPSGVYLVRLQVGTELITHTLRLVK